MAMLVGAGAAASVAVAAAVAERRRAGRADPDAVGFMPWQAVQMVAFAVALVLAALATRGL